MDVRKMSRLTARVAVLSLALMCGRVNAAAPQLPASAIADDTYLVATISVAKLDPASLDAAAKAVLGAQAAMVADGLAKYKAKYDEYAGTGAEAVTFVLSGTPQQEGKPDPEPVVYVKFKPGSDQAMAEKKVREAQAKEGKPDEMEITHEGDFMVMHKKGTEMPKSPSADRARAFAEILGNAEKAVTFAFNPTDKIREDMKKALKPDASKPAWVQAMSPFLGDSKWTLIEAKFGETPTIGMTIQAADEAGAKGISDAVAQGGQQLKAQADQMKQAGPQFAGMVDAMSSLADVLKPVQAGSKVSLNIDAKAVGPAVSNLLPFLMMGAGGGGPRGGPQ